MAQIISPLECPKNFSTPIGGSKGIVPNSSESFIKYYCAQNIRNKIKHPFYICYHFDQVFTIYHNSTAEGTDLVLSLEFIKSANPLPNNVKSLFMIVVLETEEKLRKKILQILEKWKLNHI